MMHSHHVVKHHQASALNVAAWHYSRFIGVLILIVAAQVVWYCSDSGPTAHRRIQPNADIWTTVPNENLNDFFRVNSTALSSRLAVPNDRIGSSKVAKTTSKVPGFLKEPYTLPLNVMNTYMKEHSNQQLLKELEDCEKQFQGGQDFDPTKDCPALANRNFMVAHYSCPNQGGNRLHHFMNGLFWGMVTNRTVLWHYYDKETCLDIGAAHSPMLCEMTMTEEVCSQYLERADWIPSATEWSRILNLSKPELSPWWSTHMPPKKDKNGTRVDKRSRFLQERHPWHEGDEKYTGLDVYPQRVLHIGQMHSWEASALNSEKKRNHFLNTTNARDRAESLLAADLPFLYGMMFHHAFEYSPANRPNHNKVVDSSKMTTIGLHSRHGLVSDDGSNVDAEKKCISQLLDVRQGPCAVYIMSDRDTTVNLLKDHVESVLECKAIVDDTNDSTNRTSAFDGKFAEMGSNPSGFWKEMALVSSARDGFIGIERSSSKLLEEQMYYHSIMEGKSPPGTCYLPDRERLSDKKKSKGTKLTKPDKDKKPAKQTKQATPPPVGNTTAKENQQTSPPTNSTLQVHSPRIQQISLLGERNSGTRWTYAHLSNCFNHTLGVELFLTRYKHWFQDPKLKIHPLERETLVIAQFRNPYDWLEAMRDRPHHAPDHLDVDWQEFLSRPWTMERIGSDLNITSDETQCQHGFKFNQINSCAKAPLPRESYPNIRMSRHQPFYELKQDASGEPFQSIIEMRAAKIKNFLETKDYPHVADTWPVHYEYLLQKGTKEMLDKIAQITGVDYKCDPYLVQERRKRELPQEYMDYVSIHVDWETEGLIGYHRERSEVADTQTTVSSPNALFLNQDEITWNVKRYFF